MTQQYQIVHEAVQFEGEGGNFPVGTQVWTVLTAADDVAFAVTHAQWLWAFRALTIEEAALWIVEQERAAKIAEQHPVTMSNLFDSMDEAREAKERDAAIIAQARAVLVPSA